MRIDLYCCTKPMRYTHNAGAPLFKGEKPEPEAKPQAQPQPKPQSQQPQAPAADTVQISKPACEGKDCKK